MRLKSKAKARKRGKRTGQSKPEGTEYTTVTDTALEALRPEALRRLNAVLDGRNPDSGALLEPGDEARLRPGERVALQMFACAETHVRPAGDVLALIEAYGQGLSEEPRFLTETTIQTPNRDFVTRITPAATALGGFSDYDLAVIELAREQGRYILQDITDNGGGECKPNTVVLAWWALLLANSLCLPVPGWVLNYLAAASAKIINSAQPAGAKKIYRKEAERVGAILGFASRGRGHRSMSRLFKNYFRDREIYDRIVKKLPEARNKLDSAYDEVKREMGLKRSMVVRAYLRMREPEDKHSAERPTAS